MIPCHQFRQLLDPLARTWIAGLALAGGAGWCQNTEPPRLPVPPIVAAAWSRVPDSAEIDAWLATIAIADDRARLVRIGTSAGGRPLTALLVSAHREFLSHARRPPGHLVVAVVGSQHGTEPAGAEALQRAIPELLGGPLAPHLRTMSFVLIVNANPDGRDNHKPSLTAACRFGICATTPPSSAPPITIASPRSWTATRSLSTASNAPPRFAPCASGW